MKWIENKSCTRTFAFLCSEDRVVGSSDKMEQIGVRLPFDINWILIYFCSDNKIKCMLKLLNHKKRTFCGVDAFKIFLEWSVAIDLSRCFGETKTELDGNGTIMERSAALDLVIDLVNGRTVLRAQDEKRTDMFSEIGVTDDETTFEFWFGRRAAAFGDTAEAWDGIRCHWWSCSIHSQNNSTILARIHIALFLLPLFVFPNTSQFCQKRAPVVGRKPNPFETDSQRSLV